MASLRICAERRNGTSLLLHLFCFFTLSKVSHSYSLRFACARTRAQLVKLSTHQMSYFPWYFCRTHKPKFTFPSSQSALWNNGADSAASHQEASALLRSLNLPQHTGMFSVEQTGLRICSVFLPLCWHFFPVYYDPMVDVFLLFFWHNKIKRKAIHCVSQTASIKQRSPALCVASLHRWGATCTLTLEPSVRAAAVELKLGP